MDVLEHLRKLWMLKLIVDHGSFRDAAIVAKVTPSAVSQTISQLELLTERVLLERDRGKVAPTPYCLEVLERVGPLLREVEKLRGEERERDPQISWLSLGAEDCLAATALPQLVGRLRGRFPQIRITIRSGRSDTLTAMVRNGEICMALVTGEDCVRSLEVAVVARDRLALFVSSRITQHSTPREAVDDLGLGVLAPGHDGPPRHMKAFLASAGISRSAVLLCDGFETLRQTALRGLVVALLPVRALGSPPELRELPPSEWHGRSRGLYDILLVSRKNCDPSERALLLRELRDLFQEQDESMGRHACAPTDFVLHEPR